MDQQFKSLLTDIQNRLDRPDEVSIGELKSSILDLVDAVGLLAGPLSQPTIYPGPKTIRKDLMILERRRGPLP